MANRSTVNSVLPRDLKRMTALVDTPFGNYTKEIRKLFKGAGPEGYAREIRKLFVEAHAHHRAYKLQKLQKEVVASLKETDETTVTV